MRFQFVAFNTSADVFRGRPLPRLTGGAPLNVSMRQRITRHGIAAQQQPQPLNTRTPYHLNTLSLRRLAWLCNAAHPAGMAKHYLCLPVDLSDDPRTRHLGGLLGVDALPLLVRLFSWTVRQSPDGMVGHYHATVIASAAGWTGDADALLRSLQLADWLLSDGSIADWPELYRVEARRIAACQIKQRQRSRKPPAPVSTGQSGGNPLSSRSMISEISEGESLRGGAPPAHAPRMVPTLADPWHTSDPSVLRAYLLAIPGPATYLALPDPTNHAQTNLDALRARFPAWDGQDGRPTIDQRAESTWDALRARVQRHTSDPYRALAAWEQWIGDRHDQAAQRLRRSSGDLDASAIASPLASRFRPLES